uniref:Reverse transcriptase zinc-binding domain-containing protein n=1 Tax=Acanthochromis polyacanthus TaxID=80966 RepID=A0A3Q1EQT2_9TELE
MHYTPSVIAKYSKTSDRCWRNCGIVGDFTHIFWDCQKIMEFWSCVKAELRRTLGVDLLINMAMPLVFKLNLE